jgi:hypothetical protein
MTVSHKNISCKNFYKRFCFSWISLLAFSLTRLSANYAAEEGTISETPIPAVRQPVKSQKMYDSIVTAEVRSHMLSLRPVYGNYVKKNPELGGRLVLTAVINENGKVVNKPEIQRSTLDFKVFEDQVIDTIMNWNFGRLADKTGTDTVRFVLSFAQSGNLVRVIAADAKMGQTEVEWLRGAIKRRLADFKDTYVNWVGFYGSAEGLAKLQMKISVNGTADDINVVWNSGLPAPLIDSLQSSIQKLNKNTFPKQAAVSTATAYVRFEDLHNDPVLLINGDLKTMPTWLQQLIENAARPQPVFYH